MHIDIYYSYACRESYLVYAWLKRVQKSGQSLDINWLPFAIQMDNLNEYWTQPWESANSELRGFSAAEAARRQGSEYFDRFHDALELAVHEQLLELRDETTLLGAAQLAGVDLDQFQADWHDPQLAQEAQRKSLEGVENLNVLGTPNLVFPNGRSIHLELSEVPKAVDSLELFRAIEMLAIRLPYVNQFKKTN